MNRLQEIVIRDRDETEIVRLQKRLEELTHLLRWLGHDLREPLCTISCYSDLLKRKSASKEPDTAEYLYLISAAAKRMDALVSRILDYAGLLRSERPRFSLVDVNAAVQAAFANLQGKINEMHAVIVANQLPNVWGDPVQLCQLIQNLIGNAIKYKGKDMPQIIVRAEEHRSQWLFLVEDNGIGIATVHHKRLFQPFSQLNPRSEGLGLGLAICKHIVEHHGGRIWVKSSSARGTTFAFTLPRSSQCNGLCRK